MYTAWALWVLGREKESSSVQEPSTIRLVGLDSFGPTLFDCFISFSIVWLVLFLSIDVVSPECTCAHAHFVSC